MGDWLRHPATQTVLGIGVVLVASYYGFRILMALRPSTSKADTSATDLVGDFEEMQTAGDISAEELRNIRAVLGRNQQQSEAE